MKKTLARDISEDSGPFKRRKMGKVNVKRRKGKGS
jgi:hypothetical protein